MTIDDVVNPVTVHIVKDDTKTTEKRPEEIRTAHRTIVLTAANPYVNIAGYDPARIQVNINVFDNPVVLSGDISQASDVNNFVTGLTAPNGRLLSGSASTSYEYEIKGQDEMWVSAAVYPTRVAFTIMRKI